MLRSYFLTLLIFFALTGCATTYQLHGLSGGYSERQLSENAFQIRFNGNGYTSWDKAKDFALLRSAEVADMHGYRYFIIVDSADTAYGFTYTTPATTTTKIDGRINPSANSFRATAKSTVAPGQTLNIVKPSTDNFIVCFTESPQGLSLVYDTKYVIPQIRGAHGL